MAHVSHVSSTAWLDAKNTAVCRVPQQVAQCPRRGEVPPALMPRVLRSSGSLIPASAHPRDR